MSLKGTKGHLNTLNVSYVQKRDRLKDASLKATEPP